ncbi:MAG TPA: glutaminyl-peptide cyclotransferase, partial [Acidimicrobiales bacterium]|nr:glutaminyl-peptide cyclotransferase [Acidimicrobiales bacterium]
DDRAIQLTWKAGRAVVWDLATLSKVDVLTYGGQGWGLCGLGETGPDGAAHSLVMSDGSDHLTFRNFDLARSGDIAVRLDGRPVERLNELECVDGTVWANVWLTDTIVAIDPSTGAVTAVVDASGLLADRSTLGDEDVLNGIAHDPETGRFLLTGKRWPVLFEVVFEPVSDEPDG